MPRGCSAARRRIAGDDVARRVLHVQEHLDDDDDNVERKKRDAGQLHPRGMQEVHDRRRPRVLAVALLDPLHLLVNGDEAAAQWVAVRARDLVRWSRGLAAAARRLEAADVDVHRLDAGHHLRP